MVYIQGLKQVTAIPTSLQTLCPNAAIQSAVVAQASGLRWRLALQHAVFPAQVVITLEKLCLHIKSRSALCETARLATQRRDVPPDRCVEAFQELSRDLPERDKFFDAEDHPSGH